VSGGTAGTADVSGGNGGGVCFILSPSTLSFNKSTVFSILDLSSKSIDDE
jgi:hypothetical protein